VVVASVSSNLPGTGRAGLAYQADGAVYDRDGELPLTRSISIRPSFFSTFDVGVVRGRPYTDLDLESNERVILVNESFARSAFPDGAALGRRIRFGTLDNAGDWSTIVGIVPDMWTPGGFVYQTGEECVFPVLKSSSNLYVAVRGRGDAASQVSIIRESVAAMDRDIAPTDFLSMKIVASRHALLYAVFGAAFMISGVASLFLAVLGLYSIMAFAVASRSYEMGVRMALGAKARNVIMLILRQGVSQIAIGLGVGLALGAGLAVALQRVILSVGGDTVDMNPLDPVLFVGIMAILAATGLTACFVPARRATRVDPMIAVRVE